jgi:hypothetical protein
MTTKLAVFALAAISVSAQEVGYSFITTRGIEPEARVVTGAPYSAHPETVTTQVLADGNRISRTVTAFVARDSMGRTRREQDLGMVGPWATNEKLPPLVMINDPVAGARYTLEPNSRSAVKLPVLAEQQRLESMAKMKAEARANEARGGMETVTVFGSAGYVFSRRESSNVPDNTPRVESLGSKMIEGVQAEGKRVTEIIPEGKIGNERPIEIVNETWYSPELQTTVMSKHSDPRSGDVVYTLKNISRAEPDPALFTVPPDYKIREEGKGFEMRRLEMKY